MAGNTTASSQTPEELKAESLRTLGEARKITEEALKAERELTDAEYERINELMLQAEGLDSRRKSALQAAGRQSGSGFTTRADDITGLFGSGAVSRHGTKTRTADSWGAAVVKECSDGPHRFKGITPNGSVLVDVPAPEAVAMGRPVASLRSMIPAQPTDGVYAFMRQTLRENNAAAVPHGTRKPVSKYTFERVQQNAVTLAHLSQPLHRQDLSDAVLLQQVISDEMRHGLEMELEAQVIGGTGAGGELIGLAGTPGYLTVARVLPGDDYGLLLTLRKAITALENQGIAATGWICSPSDYEAIEMLADESGQLMLTSAGQALPIDRAARRLFGLPVVSTPSCPPGYAWLADFTGSTRLYIREEARLDWSEHLYDPNLLGVGQGASLYETNQLVFRVEARFGFAVTRPTGVVRVSLA